MANDTNPNDFNFITSGLSPEFLDSITQYDGDRGLNLNGGNIDNFVRGVNAVPAELTRTPGDQAQQTTESPAAATEPPVVPNNSPFPNNPLGDTTLQNQQFLEDWSKRFNPDGTPKSTN